MTVTVVHGDACALQLPDESVDAVITDPPYSLAFMGRDWDRHDSPEGFQKWCEVWAREAFRVLKPGGWMLAFGGTRTFHRLTCGIEDAGFEIRDSITWIYASGFPKSHDIGKAIDKAAGATREVIGPKTFADGTTARRTQKLGTGVFDDPVSRDSNLTITAPATDDARRWQGWGTALKPASEPIVVARKPFVGTVAGNILMFGTGALNIDATRVPGSLDGDPNRFAKTDGGSFAAFGQAPPVVRSEGRWPSNVVWTHAPECDPDGECAPGCPVAELDAQSGVLHTQDASRLTNNSAASGVTGFSTGRATRYPDAKESGASRYFPTFRYEAKAPTDERPVIVGDGDGRVLTLGGRIRRCVVCGSEAINSGALEPSCGHGQFEWVDNDDADDAREGTTAHPTVKPVDLMRWLVRLVLPPGGVGLDMFAGSGTTGEAFILEDREGILVEKDAAYLPLIYERLRPYRDPVTLARARGRDIRPKRGKKKKLEVDGLF
jgi:hypothetical protein